jgi:putative hemolysin
MEPPSSILIDSALIAACILAVAVLSAAESSFISVNKIRIRSLTDSGDKRAVAVQKILDNHDRLFSAVILSGNLFTVLATSLGTAMMIRIFGAEYGIVAATLLMTFLTVVFGELTPKTFAVTHSERLSLFLARPVSLYIRLISPFIWIFHNASMLILKTFGVKERPASPYVTEEEIKAMINIGEEEGEIEEEEKEMLHRVFEFGDTEASEAMVPRTEMITIKSTDSVVDAMKLVAEKGYSRYPVIEENIDDIKGVLYIKDLFITMSQTEIDSLAVSNFMRDAFYVPENKMVSELLDDMRKNKTHIAIVMDEYGGTAGIVTLEDIMEEIVGNLQDEFENIESEHDVKIIDENTAIVAGHTPLDELNGTFGKNIESEDFNTIGGYVFGLFGRLPEVGEQAMTNDFRFIVVEMDNKKVSKIKITKL